MLTILFDLSDVLIKGLEGAEEPLAVYLGLPKAKIFSDLFDFDYHRFWLGKISENEVIKQLIKKNKWQISPDKLRKIIYGNFREIKGTRKLILDLKKRYQLILLSVNPPEWAVYFEKNFSYRNLFNYIHYSYEIGYTKREPESYLYVTKRHHLNPNEVLLIDDSTRNINIAKSVGIDGIKFLSSSQMRKALIARKVI